MAKLETLTTSDHEVRARSIQAEAARFLETGSEWAAVALFYSAYHLVKAALLTDPIFTDRLRLQAKDRLLDQRAQRASRHRGYFKPGAQSRAWGVNELVALLYPRIAMEYELLHLASIQVRYQRGLLSSLPALMWYEQKIRAEYDTGRLRA